MVDLLLLPFWAGMLEHIWQSTLILIPLLLLGRLMGDSDSRYLSAFWWLAFAKLLLPIALLGPVLQKAISHGLALLGVLYGGAHEGPLARVTAVLSPLSVVAVQPVGWETLLNAGIIITTLLWLLGVVWISARLRREVLETKVSGNITPASLSPELRTRLESAIRGTLLRLNDIDCTGASTMPGVVGFLKPRIRIPVQMVAVLSPEELRAILIHEDEHRRLRHPLLFLGMRVVHCIFFFYPLLPALLRRLVQSCEYLCDDAVLRQGIDPDVYSGALIRTVQLGLEPSSSPSALGYGPFQLRERLRRITKNGRIRNMFRHRFVAVTAAFIVTSAFFFPRTVPAVNLGGHDAGTLRDESGTLHDESGTLRDESGTLHDESGTIGNQQGNLNERSVSSAPSSWASQDTKAASDKSSNARAEVDVQNLKRIRGAVPEYPERAKADHKEGKVVLQALLKTDGTVKVLQVLEEVEGYPEFSEAAIAATEQWLFEPYFRDGEAIEVVFVQPYNFLLK